MWHPLSRTTWRPTPILQSRRMNILTKRVPHTSGQAVVDPLTRTSLSLSTYTSRYNECIVPLTCYLDAFSGISGDMLVGALADAGADEDAIAQAVQSLGVGATVSFDKVQRGGIAATKYRVSVEEEHADRHLAEILEMISRSAI